MGCVSTLLLCAWVLGCADLPGPPSSDPRFPNDQIWTSEHFRYAARAGDTEVCAGVVDQLEAHLQAINSYLGLDWRAGVIDYYKFRDLEDFQANANCPSGSVGCATPSVDVRSTRVLHGHELIHVYMGPVGEPPLVFSEGIAEALSAEGRTFPAPMPSSGWTWRDSLAAPQYNKDDSLNQIIYDSGGWFVTYLLSNFGPAAFVAFYGAVSRNDTADEVARQFQGVYGLDLDDVWNDVQTTVPQFSGVPVWECASATPMVLGGDAAPVTGTCDGHGPFARLELASPTTFTWTDDSIPDFGIIGCDPDGGPFTQIEETSYSAGALALPAGKYCVTPNPPSGVNIPGPLATIRFREASGVLAPNCDSLAPVALVPTYDDTLTVVIANGAEPWFAMPQIPTGNSFRLRRLPDSYGQSYQSMIATVEACDTCQGPCQIIDSESQTQVSNGMVLRFTNLTALDGVTNTGIFYAWGSQ